MVCYHIHNQQPATSQLTLYKLLPAFGYRGNDVAGIMLHAYNAGAGLSPETGPSTCREVDSKPQISNNARMSLPVGYRNKCVYGDDTRAYYTSCPAAVGCQSCCYTPVMDGTYLSV
jgi:hypothetical protein